MGNCLFDYAIFDPDIFETCFVPATPRTGSHRRNRRIDYGGYQKQVVEETERYEMKLSQMLAEQLQATLNQNAALLEANNNLLHANRNLTEAVSEIKATVVPAKPEMDPQKKEVLMQRLEAARAAKEAKKKAEEEKRQKMLKNLAKARKARGKNA